jgi:predicted PurR-regulated permease PerM
MQRDEKERLHRYLFFGIIFVLIVLSFFIIRSFIVPLISAFVLAFLIKPLFDIIEKKTNKVLSAIICILLIILAILIPLGTITAGITAQAYQSLNDGFLTNIVASLSENILQTNINLTDLFNTATSALISLLTSALSYIPSLILSLLVTILAIYYILINWDFLEYSLKKYLPFENKDKISREIAETTKNMVHGTILIGIIEFILSFVVFYALEIPYPLLLSGLIFLLAFIPAGGPTIVWGPLALYSLINQDYTSAISLLILGAVLAFFVEIFLKSKLTTKNSQINIIVMIIGIVGGIALFGIFGFIIGPLILAYTLKLIETAFDAH